MAASVVVIRSGAIDGLGRRSRLVFRYLPVPAVALLLVAFTAYESNRSWTFYSQTGQYDSALEFGSYRLLAYYTTSINNGEFILISIFEIRVPGETLFEIEEAYLYSLTFYHSG